LGASHRKSWDDPQQFKTRCCSSFCYATYPTAARCTHKAGTRASQKAAAVMTTGGSSPNYCGAFSPTAKKLEIRPPSLTFRSAQRRAETKKKKNYQCCFLSTIHEWGRRERERRSYARLILSLRRVLRSTAFTPSSPCYYYCFFLKFIVVSFLPAYILGREKRKGERKKEKKNTYSGAHRDLSKVSLTCILSFSFLFN
jgi:hypothetical protein